MKKIKEKNTKKEVIIQDKRYSFEPDKIDSILVKQIDYNSVVTTKPMEEILKEISPLKFKEIEESFFNLSEDTNFKLVMGDPNFLSDFLSAYYNKKIKPQDIRYNTIERSSLGGKIIRADLLVLFKMDGKEHKIFLNLEMQNKYDEQLNDRMFNYLIIIKSLNIKSGDDYKSDVYEGIWFMPTSAASNFIKDDSYLTTYCMQSDNGNKLTDDKISVIDLHKMSKCGIKVLEDIAKLFIAKSSEEIDNMQTDIGIKWRNKLMVLNADFVAKYNMFLHYSHEEEEKSYGNTKYKEGHEDGLAKGLGIGKTEKAIDIARNMLNKGTDINFVSECTGLSIKEIEELIK